MLRMRTTNPAHKGKVRFATRVNAKVNRSRRVLKQKRQQQDSVMCLSYQTWRGGRRMALDVGHSKITFSDKWPVVAGGSGAQKRVTVQILSCD